MYIQYIHTRCKVKDMANSLKCTLYPILGTGFQEITMEVSVTSVVKRGAFLIGKATRQTESRNSKDKNKSSSPGH